MKIDAALKWYAMEGKNGFESYSRITKMVRLFRSGSRA